MTSPAAPLTPAQALAGPIAQALALLPAQMTSAAARAMLVAIALQESRLTHRWQIVAGQPGTKGPARGLWQFERGTQASRGGVWGLLLHPATAGHLRRLCEARNCPPDPTIIWQRLETDDVLAAGLARLLLWSDPLSLPDDGDNTASWALYLRTWRPGKPHPATWPGNYAQAWLAVQRSAQ